MASEVTIAMEGNASSLQVGNAESQSTRNLIMIVSLINNAPDSSSLSDWSEVASRLVSKGEMTREDAELVSRYVKQKVNKKKG